MSSDDNFVSVLADKMELKVVVDTLWSAPYWDVHIDSGSKNKHILLIKFDILAILFHFTMKTKVIPRLLIPVTFFLFLLIIYSCHKEYLKQQLETDNNQFSVTEAMNWFNANRKDIISNLVTNSANDKGRLSKLSNFNAIWNKASSRSDSNWYAVEAPIKYLHYIAATQGADTIHKNSVTRLLILKNRRNNQMAMALMHIIGNLNVDINNVHYDSIPKDFSGNIFYTSLIGDL